MRRMIFSLVWFIIGVLHMCNVSIESEKEKPNRFVMIVDSSNGLLCMLLGILYQLDT